VATELDVALQRFYTVQVRWSANGAFDTEPRSVMNGLLEQVYWDGRCGPIPRTVQGWQLFSGMKGNQQAVRELASAASAVIRAAKKIPRGGPRRYL
jgi:hypothetical protein